MNSSYLAVPGRGGASDGRPPAQCGRASEIPAASLSLRLLHPPSAHAGSATATIMAIWRMLMGICEASQSLGDGFAWGLRAALDFRLMECGVWHGAQPCFPVART